MDAQVITIDGPAASGKSTVARALAERLGFAYLDTGAFYRAVTLKAMRAGVKAGSGDAVTAMLGKTKVTLLWKDGRVVLDGEDVSEEIRTEAVTARVREFADDVSVREFVNAAARDVARGTSVVAEGRDQGTIVFAHARWKFFLTAGDDVRAERRFREAVGRGQSVEREQIARAIDRRDAADRAREIAPLVPASNAVEVDTSNMSVEEVVDILYERIRRDIPDA